MVHPFSIHDPLFSVNTGQSRCKKYLSKMTLLMVFKKQKQSYLEFSDFLIFPIPLETDLQQAGRVLPKGQMLAEPTDGRVCL